MRQYSFLEETSLFGDSNPLAVNTSFTDDRQESKPVITVNRDKNGNIMTRMFRYPNGKVKTQHFSYKVSDGKNVVDHVTVTIEDHSIYGAKHGTIKDMAGDGK